MNTHKFVILLLVAVLLSACQIPASSGPAPAARSGVSEEATAASASPFVPDTAVPSPQEPDGAPATTAATIIPTATLTVSPKLSPAPEETAEIFVPLISGADTPERYPYIVQVGTPVATTNFVAPEAGCDWMGIGGQVFDLEGKPVSGLIVEAGGVLEGKGLLFSELTGSSQVLGPGGFQIKLADTPIASQGSLWLQMFNLAGDPQTERVYFDTYGDSACDRNLTILNFTGVAVERYEYRFPMLYR